MHCSASFEVFPKTMSTREIEREAQSIQQAQSIKRITWIGMGSNLFLAVLKFIVGTLGNSQAVIADAVHSLSDMTTDLAILFGVKFWTAPADEDHPYGHERIETVVTVLIGFILGFVAVEIGYEGLAGLRETNIRQPGKIALIGAVCSILLKEMLYHWTLSTGRRAKSPAVIANAWHHRSDALSSIPALLAVSAAILNPELAFVDHIGAFVVSLFILKVAWDIMKPALHELTDGGASRKQRRQIRSLALDVSGVETVHKIRTRQFGESFFVDLHVLVDGEMSVRNGHDIAESVQKRLIDQGPDIADVVVHIEPYGDPEE